MNVSIRDKQTLLELKPLEIIAYLGAQGWHRAAELGDKASLWLYQPPDGDELDITVPLRREFADYALRVGEILETLARAEQRSELAILRDIETTSADVLRLRVTTDGLRLDSLPMEEAVTLMERGRDLMLAASCSALDKRAFFAKRKPTRAMDYLEQVRVGQSEPGSYILTLLSPVPPALQAPQSAFFDTGDPFERRVTRGLVDSLLALQSAARQALESRSVTPFDAAVHRGVSANLCDAVTGLANVSRNGGLDLHVTWSRSRPVQPDFPTRVILDSDTMPIIAEAGRHFRATTPLEDFEVVGVVTKLSRDADAQDGEVTITGDVEGQLRRIGVRLADPIYSLAVRAHDERRTVQCSGDLIRTGLGYQFQNPRHFRMLDDEVLP